MDRRLESRWEPQDSTEDMSAMKALMRREAFPDRSEIASLLSQGLIYPHSLSFHVWVMHMLRCFDD